MTGRTPVTKKSIRVPRTVAKEEYSELRMTCHIELAKPTISRSQQQRQHTREQQKAYQTNGDEEPMADTPPEELSALETGEQRQQLAL